MKTGLFFCAALIAVTVLLTYLLKKWVKKNVGKRRPEGIEPGEGFFFYEHGQHRLAGSVLFLNSKSCTEN